MRDGPTTPLSADPIGEHATAAHAAFAVERRDRQRLAGELHDEPIQVLSAAQWQLEALALELSPEHQQRLRHSANALAHVQRQLRAIMFRLDPPALVGDGLAVAVQDLLEETFGSDGPQLELECTLSEPPIGSAAVMFRVLNAAVEEARRTASTVLVRATLCDDGDGVRGELDVRHDAPIAADRDEVWVDWCAALAEAAGGWLRRSVDVASARTECWLPRW